jgi:hypothetical protein
MSIARYRCSPNARTALAQSRFLEARLAPSNLAEVRLAELESFRPTNVSIGRALP